MKQITYTEMDYGEFENIVNKFYNTTDYEFVAVQECGNDSSHTFNVKKEPIVYKWDLDRLAEMRKGIFPTYCNYLIFQDLVNASVLEPGEYLIHVSW